MKKNLFFYDKSKVNKSFTIDYLKNLSKTLKEFPLKEFSIWAILIGNTVLIYHFFFKIHFLPYLETNELINLSLILFFGIFIYIFSILYLFIFGNEIFFEKKNIYVVIIEFFIIYTIYKIISLFIKTNPILIIGGIINFSIIYQIIKIKNKKKDLEILIIMIITLSIYFSLPQLSNQLIHLLKLGNFYASLVIQNPYACKNIKQINILTKTDENNKTCKLNSVYVLWRGENNIIIQVSDNQNYKEDFVIKQRNVKSFSILEN